MARTSLLGLLSAVALGAATPAFAQFPNIFEQLFRIDPPPRPPGDMPMSPPGTQRQQSGLPPGPPPARIRREPQPHEQGLQQPGPPPQRAPRPSAPNAPPPPANTAPQPGDEIIMEPPAQKIENPTAVFSGLDKITGRIITFDVAINETVRFGALEVTPRICYTRPPTLSPNTDSFVEVDELTLQGELRRIFTGWMFATSPGLNAVEHPIYDVWLTDCKGNPANVAEAPPEATPAAQQQPAPQRPRQQQQQPRRVQPERPQPPPGTALPPPPFR